jgi:uncharacterized sulfatase
VPSNGLNNVPVLRILTILAKRLRLLVITAVKLRIMKHLPLLLLLLVAPPQLSRAAQPNIIVFYTDDHGFADLGIQGVKSDVKTPHIDALARSGVVAPHGYTTAPQCVPSRAGLLTGRFQSRFGVESNGSPLDGFNAHTTFAKRLQNAGYVTAQFGKWHLGPGPEIHTHGFTHVFAQNAQRPFTANITVDGRDRPTGDLAPDHYHVDACSQAAASLVERYKDKPFFLYVAYRAPHVPLDPPAKYLARFPGKMPERRRKALAMLSAVDDGVGLVNTTLQKHGLAEKTLVFLIGDNGAPLKITKADEPGNGPGWDGSLNDPLNGEKGMLAEGGMHVPFVVAWPGTIPAGQKYHYPISTLDVAATAVALGVPSSQATSSPPLDGVNLIPHLTGADPKPPHDFLAWRWIAQSAIREGDWKLLRGGSREYLFNLATDLEEKHNLASQHSEIAERLRTRLAAWSKELSPPGLSAGEMAGTWNDYFDFYFEGKPVPGSTPDASRAGSTANLNGWIARGGSLTFHDGIYSFTPDKQAKASFLAKAKINVAAPTTAILTLKSTAAGPAEISWRTAEDREFLPANRAAFQVTRSDDWQTHSVPLPAQGRIIHLRVRLPSGASLMREVEFKP